MNTFQSTKTFNGYPACFRQWKAEDTHCKFVHSYIIKFKLIFEHDEEKIWKSHPEFFVYLKNWFKNTFDHITFIAADDPYLEQFKQMDKDDIIQLKVLESVGCERFSEYVFYEIKEIIKSFNIKIHIKSVETFEHSKNSALFIE
jgi:6-pyruvoyltetrahydropterin/6-carboxytetrahydropterin synthase